MNGGNWKMKCVDDGGCSFCKTGNVYEVKNGKFQREDGGESCKYESFEGFVGGNVNTNWELIKEESKFTLDDIKEGYFVKIRDGRLLLVVKMEDGLLRGYDKNSTFIVGFHEYIYQKNMCVFLSHNKIYDIMEVYGYGLLSKPHFDLEQFLFSTSNRTLLYKREELSPQQLKLKKLEDKQRKITDKISKLRESL